MSKVAVVYWSGTGNTEIMANKVAEGAKAGGAEVEVFEAEGFSADKMDEFDAVAFGCPSMGCEELEDTIFEPMFASCESNSRARRLHCLVLMDGAMENGCRTGKKPAKTTVRPLHVTA